MTDGDGASAKIIPLKGGKCPICGKPAALDMRPFCSKRCADLDLGKWLGGDYRVHTEERPDDPAAIAQAQDDDF